MFKEWSKKIVFLGIFILAGFVAMQIPFTNIVGSSAKFTIFDFYGPIVGGFLGSILGFVAMLIMQMIGWIQHGFATDTTTLIRLLPMFFAMLYFAKKSRLMLAVPAIAMVAFWAHPEGRAAWYYALYWLIPFICHFLYNRSTLCRALGATFTAHAVGSVLFLYAFNLKASTWAALMPIVWKERGLMALVIFASYLITRDLLNAIFKKTWRQEWLGAKAEATK